MSHHNHCIKCGKDLVGGQVPEKYRHLKDQFQDAVVDILSNANRPMTGAEIVEKVVDNYRAYNIPGDHLDFLVKNKGTLLQQAEHSNLIEREELGYKTAGRNDWRGKLWEAAMEAARDGVNVRAFKQQAERSIQDAKKEVEDREEYRRESRYGTALAKPFTPKWWKSELKTIVAKVGGKVRGMSIEDDEKSVEFEHSKGRVEVTLETDYKRVVIKVNGVTIMDVGYTKYAGNKMTAVRNELIGYVKEALSAT